MPRPRHERVRPLDWRGKPSPEAREAQAEYVQHLKRTGAIPYEDSDAWYVAALPDPEVRHEP